MGTQSVSIDAGGATATYEPFANSLTPFLKDGLKV
jgi:hypothetical protein